jgi:hypothetical protein
MCGPLHGPGTGYRAMRAKMPDLSHQQKLQLLGRAQDEVERWTRQLIVDELNELWPSLVEAEEHAQARLEEAERALVGPQEHIATLRVEIIRCGGRCNEWSAELTSEVTEYRVQARINFREWSAELDSLKEKLSQAERDREPLYRVEGAVDGGLADIGEAQAAVPGVSPQPGEASGRETPARSVITPLACSITTRLVSAPIAARSGAGPASCPGAGRC